MSKDNLDFIRIKICFHRHSFLRFTFVSFGVQAHSLYRFYVTDIWLFVESRWVTPDAQELELEGTMGSSTWMLET